MASSKDEYLSNLNKDYENNVHVAQFNKKLKFREFSSYSQFWNEYNKYDTNKRHFFEIIALGKDKPLPLKPYLEVEYYDKQITSSIFIKCIKKYLIEFMQQKFNKKPSIFVMDSSGMCPDKKKFKNSFHFTLLKVGHLKNIDDCRIFINAFIEFLKEKNDPIICNRLIGTKKGIPIDISVYKSWQLMRIPYSSKGLFNKSGQKDNRILYPIISNKKVPIKKFNEKNFNYLFITDISKEKTIFNIDSLIKKPEISTNIRHQVPRKCRSVIINDKKAQINIPLIKKLLNCYSYERCYEYYSWIFVGNALYNHFDGENDGLKLWIEWSKKCKEKFQLNVCKKIWSSFKKSGLQYRIGSLYYWAKCDNPKEYKKIITGNYLSKAYRAINNDYKTAELIHELFNNTIVCMIDEKNHTYWYVFDGVRFRPDFGCIYLKKKISVDLVEIYEELMNYLKKKKNEIDNGGDDGNGDDDDEENNKVEIKKLNQKILNCKKTILKLSSNGYKKSLVDECKQFFIDSDLKNKMNANPDLLVFENGVYDFKQGILREGYPEDYVSFNTSIELDLDIDTTELETEFLGKIVPNKEALDYLLRFLASCLRGVTDDQLFHFFTGVGSNGKSTLINILDKAMGDYFVTLKPTSLMGKDKNADDATPGFSKLPGKRCVGLSEPNKGSNLNLGLLKKITGCDKFQARRLYENEIEFKIQAKFIMLCNDLPEVNSIDYATWRRIRKINFPSKFVDNPTENNEFRKNAELFSDGNIKNLAKQLITLLIRKYYPKYLKEGLTPPKNVIEHTHLYLNQNNTYFVYCSDHLEKTNKNIDFIDFKLLYTKYKTWYRSKGYPYKRLDGMRKAKSEFVQHYFKEEPVQDERNGKKTFIWKKFKFLDEYDENPFTSN